MCDWVWAKALDVVGFCGPSGKAAWREPNLLCGFSIAFLFSFFNKPVTCMWWLEFQQTSRTRRRPSGHKSHIGWWAHDNESPHQTWSEFLWTCYHMRKKQTFIWFDSLLFGACHVCATGLKVNWYKLQLSHFRREAFVTREVKWLDHDYPASLPRSCVSSSKMSRVFSPPIQSISWI